MNTAESTTTQGAALLVLKGLGLAVAVALTLLALVAMTPVDAYMPAHRQKERRLQELESPKVVLVGGSAVAMSANSTLLGETLGRPVYNMGLHAGIGLRFMLDDVRPHLHEGDLLVIVGEYQHLNGLLDGELGLLRLARAEPEIVQEFTSPGQWVTLVRNAPGRVKGEMHHMLASLRAGHAVQDEGEEVMNTGAFNAHGDLVSHLNQPSPGIGNWQLFKRRLDPLDPEAFRFLERRVRELGNRGVRVCWAFPPIPDRDYEKSRQWFEATTPALKRVEGLTVLGEPSQAVWPVEDFFNTGYHLAAPARQEYTKRLIGRLEQELSLTPADTRGQ
jgi:hypothetical protein